MNVALYIVTNNNTESFKEAYYRYTWDKDYDQGYNDFINGMKNSIDRCHNNPNSSKSFLEKLKNSKINYNYITTKRDNTDNIFNKKY